MYCFLVGTGRCGSSLVSEVLARHPNVGFLSNIEDQLGPAQRISRWNGALYRRLPPDFSTKGRARFAPSEGYRMLDREVSPALSVPFRDLRAEDAWPWLADRMRASFEHRRQAQRADVFMHKFTGWPRVTFLDQVFPGSTFINVIRDGRAVALSWLQMPWWQGYKGPEQWQWGPLPEAYAKEWDDADRSFVVLAAILWKLLMDSYEQARAQIPPGQWLDVRYEDVLAQPRAQFETMLTLSGLTWTPAFERGFGRYGFQQGRRDAFRRDLDPKSVDLLETSLSSHLERYGYL